MIRRVKVLHAVSLACIAVAMVGISDANARGTYCSRHRVECSRRAEQRAKDSAEAARRERDFQASLAARLTASQMAELRRRDADNRQFFLRALEKANADRITIEALTAESAHKWELPGVFAIWVFGVFLGALITLVFSSSVAGDEHGRKA